MSSIRKRIIHDEVILTDGVGEPCAPVTRVVGMAVVRNPFAGRFQTDLAALFDLGDEISRALSADLVARLPGPAVAYGKAAIVGIDGDFEHGGAVIHPRLGAPLRAAVGGGAAVIPSNVKLGPPGTVIDLPLGHKDDPWSFDHFDTVSVMVSDAPRPDEIVVCIAVADGGRPIPRCGSGPQGSRPSP